MVQQAPVQLDSSLLPGMCHEEVKIKINFIETNLNVVFEPKISGLPGVC